VQDIPRLEIPLHTLIELTPKPDGTMAEERIPLDVKGTNPEDLAIHLQKRLNLHSGPYATPMTPFSPFEGDGSNDSPFARVDSMGMGLDQLPSVSDFCSQIHTAVVAAFCISRMSTHCSAAFRAPRLQLLQRQIVPEACSNLHVCHACAMTLPWPCCCHANADAMHALQAVIATAKPAHILGNWNSAQYRWPNDNVVPLSNMV